MHKNKYIHFLIGILCILIWLLFFEIFFRYLYPVSPQIGRDYIPRFMFQPDEELGFKHTPNFSEIMKTGEFAINISINNYSLRGQNFDFEKRNKRILFLGDSFTFGFGVEAEESFPFLLKEMLNKKGLNYEVINAGVMGYGNDQEAKYLELNGLKFFPDVLVLGFFADNDLSDNADYSNISIVNGFLVRDYTKLDSNTLFLLGFLKQKWVIIYAKLKRMIIPETTIIKDISYNYQIYSYLNDSYAWDKTYESLEKIVNLSKKSGIPLILINIPSVDTLTRRTEYSLLNDNALEKFIATHNLSFIDLVLSINNLNESLISEDYFPINKHLNKKGNKYVAEIIFEYLNVRHLLK